MADDAELRISITDNTPRSPEPRSGDRQGGYRDAQGRWRSSQTHRFASDPDSARRVGASPSGGRTGAATPSRTQVRQEARDRSEGMAKALARALGRYIGGTAGRFTGGTFGRVIGSAAGNVVGSQTKNAVSARLGSFGSAGKAGGIIGGGVIAVAGVATMVTTLLQIQRFIQGRLASELGKLNGTLASSLGMANLNETLAKLQQADELADELSTFIDKESEVSIAVRELQTSLITTFAPLVTDLQDFIINILGWIRWLVDYIPTVQTSIVKQIQWFQDIVGEWIPKYGEMIKESRAYWKKVAEGEEKRKKKEQAEAEMRFYRELESLVDSTIEGAGIEPPKPPRQ